MSISAEISRLEQLRSQGTLTEDEFLTAKRRVLREDSKRFPDHGNGQLFGIAEDTWCLLMHLSQLAYFSVVGFILPIVMWAISKDESDLARRHGARMMNWVISSAIYFAIGFALLWAFVGIPIMVTVAILNVVFPIVAALKCKNGKIWSYPLSIRFFDEE